MTRHKPHSEVVEEISALFAAMGSALTRWSMVDRKLTVVYSVAVNPRRPRVAAASIWRVTGHNLKVEMTHAALHAMCKDYPSADPSGVLSEWAKANKIMNKAARGRNDLSHASLYGVLQDEERISVLQKDREKFAALLSGEGGVRNFDCETIRSIELDCFDASYALGQLLHEMTDFYKSQRIRMQEDSAFPEPLGFRRR